MSKLNDIKAALEDNPQVTIISVKSSKPSAWNDWWDIVVTPREGLYSGAELQQFMDNIVPIPATMSDKFWESEHLLTFGKLYFDEVIGTATTRGSKTITVTDPDVTLPEGYDERGTKIISLDKVVELKRRTLVWVYPDEDYARHRATGTGTHEIDMSMNPFGTRDSSARRLFSSQG